MDIGQLIGKFRRLRGELSDAERAPAPEMAHVERLNGDLSQTAREIAARQPVDEQAGDSFLGYVD